MNGLTDDERKRYTRHLSLEEIGETGQLRLKNGRVLVVGTGGLGSGILYYLAAAGVGNLGIVDNDAVDLSNLNRQVLHTTADLGRPKVDSAREKLSRLNPGINITAFAERLTADNALEIIKGYEIVVDGTDNFATRFILNEACVKSRIPLVHGGILGFFGQAMTIVPGQGPCFKCVFREEPYQGAAPAAPGVLGAVAGTIGTIEAAETIKILLGTGRLLVGRILMYDAMEASFREVTVKRNPDCPVCGKL